MTAPSDLSVVLELALLTTDRTAAEDAALARVAAVAGLGDLIGGTQAPGGDSSLTEPDVCGWCGGAGGVPWACTCPTTLSTDSQPGACK